MIDAIHLKAENGTLITHVLIKNKIFKLVLKYDKYY